MDVLSKVGLWLAVGLATALFMELWSAVLHGRLWHGPLWPMHESHHVPSGKWEINDILSVSHAPIAMAMILYGCVGPIGVAREVLFGIGLGMTVFGFAYIIVHDGLVHGRLPVQGLAKFRYLRQVRNAHRVHHLTGEAPYGLFYGPWVVKRMAKHKQAERARASEVD
ncbi:MAG: beta-carotene 3-hydroxylase [Bradymonadia bacterium]|jgi:beta-carotene 3-hydroxylase